MGGKGLWIMDGEYLNLGCGRIYSRVGTQNTYGKEVGTEQCANLIGKGGSNCGWEAGV